MSTVPSIFVDSISITSSMKQCLYTVSVTQRHRQMESCSSSDICLFLIVLYSVKIIKVNTIGTRGKYHSILTADT